MAGCRCRFKDWRALRRALGLSQARLAEMLHVTQPAIAQLEATDPRKHACHSTQTLYFLRYELQDPTYIAAMERASFPHPFPEDVSA